MHQNRRKKYILFFFCFFIATLVFGTTVIFARYHIIQAQKGIAVASEMYFSSNYLEHTQEGDYVTKYNTDKWDADRSLFKIQLRNYENKLLYNKNVELTCDVTFQLAKDPQPGFRYVVYDPVDHEEKELNTVDDVITLSNVVIQSGQPSETEVDFGVIKTSQFTGEITDSEEVMVTASIVSPGYAADLGPLRAKLKATTSNEAFHYEAKFKIENEISETNLADKIDWASGFIYILNTTGGTVNDQVKLKISWNHDLLKLNEFDSLFVDSQIMQDKDTTRSYIEFVPKLNAHREIIFYKTEAFTDASVTSIDDFKRLVKIEKIE